MVLAIDGLQPDVGHEVLWALRDCLSGEALPARSLLSAAAKDLAPLLSEVRGALPVPITGAASDGRGSVRNAAARALPGVPHRLCHPHSLREAARPAHEAGRRAEEGLKKRARGRGQQARAELDKRREARRQQRRFRRDPVTYLKKREDLAPQLRSLTSKKMVARDEKK